MSSSRAERRRIRGQDVPMYEYLNFSSYTSVLVPVASSVVATPGQRYCKCDGNITEINKSKIYPHYIY